MKTLNPLTGNSQDSQDSYEPQLFIRYKKESEIRHKELFNPDHYENYLLGKLKINLKSYLKGKGTSNSDTENILGYLFERPKKNPRINKSNIGFIYNKPAAIILHHAIEGTLSELKNMTISYKS